MKNTKDFDIPSMLDALALIQNEVTGPIITNIISIMIRLKLNGVEDEYLKDFMVKLFSNEGKTLSDGVIESLLILVEQGVDYFESHSEKTDAIA